MVGIPRFQRREDVNFSNKDYTEAYFPTKDTLIYADPPGYYPHSAESRQTLSRGFTTWGHQLRLLKFLDQYRHSHKIIYTNAYSDYLISALKWGFKYYKVEVIERPRPTSPSKSREKDTYSDTVKLIYAKNF